MRRSMVEACGLALILTAGCRKEAPVSEAAPDLRPLVKVGHVVASFPFTDGARVQGTVRTKYSAAVAARVAGTVDAVFVDEGVEVRAGQPLFQIDKATLENRVRLAEDDRSVSLALLREAQAVLAEADAGLEKASVDAKRMSALLEGAKAVTRDTWEKAELQRKVAAASRERALAAVASGQARIVQAGTALEVARKALADSLGVAPFDGVITAKRMNKGDYASVGNPVFEMDDPSVFEVSFSLNAAFYDKVTVGQTRVRFDGGKDVPVTYKAPSVHPVTRTFEIRVTVDRSPELAPGMIRDAWVVFRQYDAPALPATAVGVRSGTNVAFVVRDGKVFAAPVDVGLSWQKHVEVRNAESLKDAAVVTEGMLLLSEGDGVRAKAN